MENIKLQIYPVSAQHGESSDHKSQRQHSHKGTNKATPKKAAPKKTPATQHKNPQMTLRYDHCSQSPICKVNILKGVEVQGGLLMPLPFFFDFFYG